MRRTASSVRQVLSGPEGTAKIPTRSGMIVSRDDPACPCGNASGTDGALELIREGGFQRFSTDADTARDLGRRSDGWAAQWTADTFPASQMVSTRDQLRMQTTASISNNMPSSASRGTGIKVHAGFAPAP